MLTDKGDNVTTRRVRSGPFEVKRSYPIVSLSVGRTYALIQIEAKKLKDIKAGGIRTKVVALGIGNAVDQAELNNIASAPQAKNVILVQDFSSLHDVEEQLRNASCTGW